MFQLSIPWWSFVIRGVVVYCFILIFLRMTGKRQIGQFAPFDLVLLLLISNTVQNSMNGGDNSLVGGLISAATLLVLNYMIGYITYKSKRMENVIEGKPEIIVHNGHVFKNVLKSERITYNELEEAIRDAGCKSISEVEYAILENNGKIIVRKKN